MHEFKPITKGIPKKRYEIVPTTAWNWLGIGLALFGGASIMAFLFLSNLVYGMDVKIGPVQFLFIVFATVGLFLGIHIWRFVQNVQHFREAIKLYLPILLLCGIGLILNLIPVIGYIPQITESRAFMAVRWFIAWLIVGVTIYNSVKMQIGAKLIPHGQYLFGALRFCKKGLAKSFFVLFVIGFPFVYLFPYIIPLDEIVVHVGNDFYILYYDYKVYLLDFLSIMKIPLWSPSEATGFPFYSSPFSQTFYPLNALLALLYNFQGGYSTLDHHRFTVLGISIFALGLVLWLRRLNFNLRSVLFGALIMAVSFKVTELLRFPNAIHTAAWYPWILYAITGAFQSVSRRRKWFYGIVLWWSLICLLTGGYPYYVFYSIFLFVPYMSLFLIPEFRSKVFGVDSNVEIKSRFVLLIAAGFSALVVCAPYLYKMASLMAQTTDRGGKSYEYSTEHLFNLTDTIGSLFFPPAAQLEGIYYFGAATVLLVLFYISNAAQKIIHPGIEHGGSHWIFTPTYFKLAIFILFWIITISYITYGRESYLFDFLWHSVPLFSSLRVWGRMNIILVPIIAWLLALAYQYFETMLMPSNGNGKLKNIRTILCLSIITSIVVFLQFSYASNKIFDSQWLRYVAPVNTPMLLSQYFPEQGQLHALLVKIGSDYAKLQPEQTLVYRGFIYISLTLTAFFLVAGVTLCFSLQNTSKYAPWVAWTVLFVFSVANMAIDGPWLWAASVEENPPRTRLHINNMNMLSFNVPRINQMGISFSENFHTGIMANWYFERYITFLNEQASDQPSLRKLLGENDGQKLYFSERIDHVSASEFLQDAQRFETQVDVASYTGDKLIVNMHAPTDGFFSFIDNWDQDWQGTVDGKPTPIYLLLGAFKSVRIPSGEHQVIFEYRPVFLR